jgi:hypothetical protein
LPWISASSLLIHRASLAASEQAIYSASVLEVATTLCFVDFHEIALLYSKKTYPEVDFQVSRSPAQSESENPVSLVSLSAVECLFNASLIAGFS